MRSAGFTLLLFGLAALVCGAIYWQAREGNLDAVFGSSAVPVGEHLYDSFNESQVHHIHISGNGVEGDFVKSIEGESVSSLKGDFTKAAEQESKEANVVWLSTLPPHDRMDPRAAASIIAFTRGMVVYDFAPRKEIDAAQANLSPGGILVELKDAQSHTLAKYRMGGLTPLKIQDEKRTMENPTVFIQPRERSDKEYVYACAGNIGPLFKDNFKRLRDHRPFYFDPRKLQKIRLRGPQGELTLNRQYLESPWRITKPIDLPSNTPAVKTLLEGLFNLQAMRLTSHATSTPPSSSAKSWQIAIQSFAENSETVLDISPPENPTSATVFATVSNRPETLFELPLKHAPEMVSLADLPTALNALRDPKLTNLNIASLRAVTIRPSTGPLISLHREKKQWRANILGQTQLANEYRVADLLNAVTKSQVTGFETDAASDFKRWGLDHPFLNLGFLGDAGAALEINFGMDPHGAIFANRTGTPTVVQVDQSLISSIATEPHEWRNALLWTLNKADLVGLTRTVGKQESITLFYDDKTETWTGRMTASGEDITEQIEVPRANFLLAHLEKIEVTRWLAAEDSDAVLALQNPLLTIEVAQNLVNSDGDFTGLERRTLTLAPAPAIPGSFYGRLNTEQNLFLLDRETSQKLVTDPLEKKK